MPQARCRAAPRHPRDGRALDEGHDLLADGPISAEAVRNAHGRVAAFGMAGTICGQTGRSPQKLPATQHDAPA